jgi:hypothetical protein
MISGHRGKISLQWFRYHLTMYASKKYFACSLRKGSGHSAAGNPDEPQESHTMFGSDDDDDVGAL